MMIRSVKKVMAIVLVIVMVGLMSINVYAFDEALDKTADTYPVNHNMLMEEAANEFEIIQNCEVNSKAIDEIINDSSKGIDDLQDAILTTRSYNDGLATKHETNNIRLFKRALEIKYPEMTDIELGKTILLALGDTEKFVSTLPEEKIIEAIGYTAVVKTETFYKETVDGEKIEMSETDYYKEVSFVETLNTSENIVSRNSDDLLVATPTSLPAYVETEILDSYIKLTSTAYKTNPSYAQPGRNYFTIRGEVEWTRTPFTRDFDVLAIASSGNVDQDYQSYAYAYWLFNPTIDHGVEDWAYIGQNGGEGELSDVPALKIYNPSIYGVAIDVQVGLMRDTGDLQFAYVYYGISTQDDVTCQVGYAHKTLGFSDPSVSIDNGGSISFSIALTSTFNDYMGRAFTLFHESYTASLFSPTANAGISYNQGAPTFVWTSNNGPSQHYTLEIDYLGNGSYISRYIQNTSSYTLSASDWEMIKKDAPLISSGVKQIKWRIKISYVIYPEEDPYCSNWGTFTIVDVPLITTETLPKIMSSNRYTENVVSLCPGGYKDVVVTFESSGNRVIQTFGAMDTVLELYSSDGSKLLGATETDDDGYSRNAFFSYNFSANISYTIRVKFYSSSVWGNTKVVIVPTYHHDSYESAYGTYASTTVSWKLGYNRVALFRYKFDSDGIATFTMSATEDTFIYVIDPSSATAIRAYIGNNADSPNLYDDDAGDNLQGRVRKSVQAGKEYLVIISFYNPNTMSGDFSIISSLSITQSAIPL